VIANSAARPFSPLTASVAKGGAHPVGASAAPCRRRRTPEFSRRCQLRWKSIARRWAVFGALALWSPPGSLAFAGDWIADAKSGCKIWNPQPAPRETVVWNGPCKDGFGEGKGVLDWLRGGSSYERDDGKYTPDIRWARARKHGPAANIKACLPMAYHMVAAFLSLAALATMALS
jgi:hypothetical protein